jgi:poly(A) polymerase
MTKQSDESSPSRTISSTTLPPLVHFLRDFFLSKNKRAYLVGGLVRDCLLSRQPLDVDIAVEGDVAGLGLELAQALGGRYVQLHQDWDIGRVVVPEGAVRDNNIGYVDLSSMQGGLEADLRRRDFTVDSLALPLNATSLTVVDVMGGLRDVDDGIVRANSDGVFREDPARLLRGIRLASQLGFSIDEDTESKIRRDAKLVSGVAPERVRDELMRILSAPAATKSIRWIDSLGLLSQVLPELDDARGVIQPKEHHWDVFNHLVEAVGHADRIIATVMSCEKADDLMMSMVPRFEGMQEYFQENIGDGHIRATFLRLTALLHDVAKPATKTVEPSGKMRFLGHHTLGEKMAGEILSRLRFSRRGTRLVQQMIRSHLRPTQMAAKGEMPSSRALFRYYRDVPDVAVDTLYLNMADFLAARGPTITEADWRDHCELMEYILVKGRQQNAPETLPKIITGRDIMNALSLQPGPDVGKLLGLAHEAQANGDVSTLDEALNLVRSLAKSRQEPGGCGA